MISARVRCGKTTRSVIGFRRPRALRTHYLKCCPSDPLEDLCGIHSRNANHENIYNGIVVSRFMVPVLGRMRTSVFYHYCTFAYILDLRIDRENFTIFFSSHPLGFIQMSSSDLVPWRRKGLEPGNPPFTMFFLSVFLILLSVFLILSHLKKVPEWCQPVIVSIIRT